MSKQIPLSRGKVAIVGDTDHEWLNQWKWSYLKPSYPGGSGYAMRRENRNGKALYVLMHRFIMNAPVGSYIDHINHDGLDNRRENLRIATPSENHYNSMPRKRTSSQYKGVYYNNTWGRWQAKIHAQGKQIVIGQFETELEAAIAYNQAATRLHGEFALLNNLDNHQEPTTPVRPLRKTTSCFNGVYFVTKKQRWVSRVYTNGKSHYIGQFPTELEAAHAYDAFVKEHSLDRPLNFPANM